MHENGHDIDHYLSNKNVDQNKVAECQAETVVSHQVFNGLDTIEYFLLIDDETTQEHDASSQESVLELGKSVLVNCEDEVTHHAVQGVGEHHHRHCFFESTSHERDNCDLDGFKLGDGSNCVFQKRNTTDDDDHRVHQLDELVHFV